MVPARRPAVVLAMSPANLPRLLDDHQRQRLAAIADVDLDLVLDEYHSPRARAALGRAEVLLTCWGAPPVDAEAVAAAPGLAAVVHGAGSVKSLVTQAAWDHGVRVSSAVAANAVPVAEYTVAMVVLAGKRASPIQAAYRADARRQDWAARFPGLGNYHTTVGIVGASHVGRRVLDLLAAYEMDVLLADPTLTAAQAAGLGARLVDLDELAAGSDVVSIHAPDVPATYHLFDARRLALMPDGATLVNTARGRLVDTAALTAETVSGRLSAVLDVTDPEPLPADSPLFGLPNVVLTPHIAGSLGNEVHRMGALAVDEVERFARGEGFAHPVDRARLDLLA
ncbi:hydroxyacid dehydrogenase [Actinopolymorpha cephalotaxi]|nr:hydroxyacid dehydrogenase [Actinopolymorpha cephalotaxi]NYH81298.1 phosphoglycerate dehydrogenase-like enzyme [Actinopolymorpha cephalotaxi]